MYLYSHILIVANSIHADLDGRDANPNRAVIQQNRRSEAQRSRRARERAERDAANINRNTNQAQAIRTEGPAQGPERKSTSSLIFELLTKTAPDLREVNYHSNDACK